VAYIKEIYTNVLSPTTAKATHERLLLWWSTSTSIKYGLILFYMASTINFTCEKCGDDFNITLGSFAHTKRTGDDDLESVNIFEKALAIHEAEKGCDGKVVFQGTGYID